MTRSGFDNPDDHVILPGTISEEPLGPVVPYGDEQWYDIVKTVMAILIYAEAFDVTSDNVPTSLTGNSAVDRLFGLVGEYGQDEMGLTGQLPGRDPRDRELRRDLRSPPHSARPDPRGEPKRALGHRTVHGLPEGRPGVRCAAEVIRDQA